MYYLELRRALKKIFFEIFLPVNILYEKEESGEIHRNICAIKTDKSPLFSELI